MISGASAILMDKFPLHKLSVSNLGGGEGGGEEIKQKDYVGPLLGGA